MYRKTWKKEELNIGIKKNQKEFQESESTIYEMRISLGDTNSRVDNTINKKSVSLKTIK